MVLQKSAWTGGCKRQVALWVLVSSCVLLPTLAQTALAQNATIATGQSASAALTSRSPDNTGGEVEEIDFAQVARDVVAAGLSKVPRSLMRKLLQADVRSECSTALLRTMRAFQNLEPWVLRLFDATGKCPTGFFDASSADLGAFDECLETVVRDRYGNVLSRGQYCNMLVHIKNATEMKGMMNSISDVLHPRLRYFSEQGFPKESPIARLGLCFIEDCNEHDLQVLVNSARLLNLFIATSEWPKMIIPAAFNGVDTFFFLRQRDLERINGLMRTLCKQALGLPKLTNMKALLMHKNVEEIIEAHKCAQTVRLSDTHAGQRILDILGYRPALAIPQRHRTPNTIRTKIIIPPLPKNMSTETSGRRKARAAALWQCYKNQPAIYVDAAHTSDGGHTIAGTNGDGHTTSSATVNTSFIVDAEETAFAMGTSIPGTKIMISDSKTAILNYPSGFFQLERSKSSTKNSMN
ncbi:hypothetical protein HPB49_002533 [Dermacentor silvarum]|uniref:Uncharacterized protein n=1 Tax=Dermacentor silvarum TaxID=543639 RepID=A0ACB8D2C8_DERSI|nr:hypothetical protein HPB49_002533 [Dermacentor silvarum]